MLSATIANDILNGLFSMKIDRKDGVALSAGPAIKFNNDIYLGLLTSLPANETNNTATEPDSHGDTSYMRIKLNANNRITKAPFIHPATLATQTTNDDGDEVQPVEVTNNGAILFPEATAPYEIVGFGLFTTNALNNKIPFLWGEVTPAISVSAEEVPVIRDQKFKISLV